MIVVESNKEKEQFLQRWNTEPSIVIPIWSDLDKHPMNNELSFLFVRMGKTDFILIYNHIDGNSPHLDLSISTQPKWVWNKKGLLQMDTKIQNIFDISNYTFFNQNYLLDFKPEEQPFISHYLRMGIRENLGKIAPLMKWGEYLKSFVDNISSIDLKSCNKFRLDSNQIANISNVKYIFCDKDKLARYNPENEILDKLELDVDIFMLNEAGHFPFYEDPDQLEEVLNKIFNISV